jgi:hypothetical protein
MAVWNISRDTTPDSGSVYNGAPTPVGGSSTVNSWYRDYAGRQGEAEGINYWQGRLDAGENEASVLADFKYAASDKGNIETATNAGYYDNSYNTGDQPWRPGDPVDLGSYATSSANPGGFNYSDVDNRTYTPPRGMLTGAVGNGYEPSSYEPARQAVVSGYAAPAKAPVSSYNAVNQQVIPNQMSGDRAAGLLASDSLYMQQARHSGRVEAHNRGALDSSLAADASQAAAIRAVQPFALQEADVYSNAASNFANATNRASEFGAREENVAALQTNQQQDAASRFGAAAENLANREYTNSVNQASAFGAAAINRAGEFYAGAQNTASIQNANNELSLALQSMRDELSTYATDVQRDTALDNLGLNLFNTAINSGVFNNADTIAGYFNTVSGIFPDLGIQLISQASGVTDDGVIV